MRDFYKGEGFAVVTFQCSLIETIECFIEGWLYLDRRWKYGEEILKNSKDEQVQNGDIFECFLSKKRPFKNLVAESGVTGLDFYINVRCGLLHETQTKNAWRIRAKNKVSEKCIVEKTICWENLNSDIRRRKLID